MWIVISICFFSSPKCFRFRWFFSLLHDGFEWFHWETMLLSKRIHIILFPLVNSIQEFNTISTVRGNREVEHEIRIDCLKGWEIISLIVYTYASNAKKGKKTPFLNDGFYALLIFILFGLTDWARNETTSNWWLFGWDDELISPSTPSHMLVIM